jgi:hypothetical protein
MLIEGLEELLGLQRDGGEGKLRLYFVEERVDRVDEPFPFCRDSSQC